MRRGGNYWTLFTPGIWKVLHAILQENPFYHFFCLPGPFVILQLVQMRV